MRIAITPGEPAGIGPDIVITLAQQSFNAELIAIADPQLLRQRAAQLDFPLSIREVQLSDQPQPHIPGQLSVIPVSLSAACEGGQLNKDNAKYVIDTLSLATQGCLDQHFDAMVTAPVQKSIINDGGFAFSGHTEFLAEKTSTPEVVMMLATDAMRVSLVTTHLPLSRVSEAITHDKLERVIRIVHQSLQTQFGINEPNIIVLGLNPHAGESGHLGHEELDTIIPCLESLRSEGLNLTGPLPADTAFNKKYLDECDTVLAMYHDQGLPVLKYQGFGEAVNITLGLPIIRTSVDHGTALDLAGTGKADSKSLEQAITMAITMAKSRVNT